MNDCSERQPGLSDIARLASSSPATREIVPRGTISSFDSDRKIEPTRCKFAPHTIAEPAFALILVYACAVPRVSIYMHSAFLM